MSKKRKSTSKGWIDRHLSDPYVKQAQVDGLRSRAAYKLLELQQKYHFINQGMTVIDLGAAPGSWCQVARQCVGDHGHIIAVDLLEMQSIPAVEFKQADFTDPQTLTWIKSHIREGMGVDIVLSDMAPNLSGVWVSDQARAMNLAEEVWWFADEVLNPGGCMLIKVFQGPGIDEFVKTLRNRFDKVIMRKPKASRAKSRENYCLAMGKKP